MLVENNNLLISLVKRASSVTEDFTTEAFVHLLTHLQQHDPTIVQDLLKNVWDLLREKKEKEKQEIDLSKPLDVKDLEFKTQAGYRLDEIRARPDISIVAPNYLIFVEVKVSADLGFDQLARYRGVLAEELKKEKEKGKSKTGILILLSCVPSTRLDSELADVAILWRQIAKWLEDDLSSRTDIGATSKYLIEQFIKFLYVVCGFDKQRKLKLILKGVNDEFRIMRQRNHGEIRDLGELDDYPRLQTVLTMMDEIIKATDVQAQHTLRNGSFIDEHAGFAFIGYDIQDYRYSFYVCLHGKECNLLFTTWKGDIDVKQATQQRFGHVVTKPDRWQAELNINRQDELNTNSPEDRTLIRESYRIGEFDRIQKFYQRSYEFARSMIKSDPSAA